MAALMSYFFLYSVIHITCNLVELLDKEGSSVVRESDEYLCKVLQRYTHTSYCSANSAFNEVFSISHRIQKRAICNASQQYTTHTVTHCPTVVGQWGSGSSYDFW